MIVSPLPPLRPHRWRMPGLAQCPAPHLHAQGWPIPARARCPRALLAGLTRASGVHPDQLQGSRVGRLWPLRAVLLTLGEDLLLDPAVRAAERFDITPPSAERMAARGRLALLCDARLRAELRPVLAQLLGIAVPEPCSALVHLHHVQDRVVQHAVGAAHAVL